MHAWCARKNLQIQGLFGQIAANSDSHKEYQKGTGELKPRASHPLGPRRSNRVRVSFRVSISVGLGLREPKPKGKYNVHPL